jgi:hypothetical protein
MMFLLAEISDKMFSMPAMWVGMVGLGIFLAAIGFTSRRAGLFVFVAGGLISLVLMYAAFHVCFLEGYFSECIMREMGGVWIRSYLVSQLCPVLFAGAVYFWRR